IPGDYLLGVSDLGYNNDELSLDWIEHFNRFSAVSQKVAWRLLIFDGFGGHLTKHHQSITFQNLCEEYKIITLYIPSHSSHLLQPLNVGCFRLLKKAYSYEVMKLSRYGNFHVTKEDFLPAFKTTFYKVFTESNI
ncbi:DDE-domain-containing protein, partial [Zopfia rhizophila CBS 207.26]